MKTKLFIVDDHHMVIEGLRAMLQHEPAVEYIGHACSAAECLSLLGVNTPDVILMDINMPDQSGIELCAEVLRRFPAMKILGLSTFNQMSYISRMMDSGASGYLLKNATKTEILQAIQVAMSRGRYFSREASEMMKKPDIDEAPVLTRREIEVLQLIAEGMTASEIAVKLYISISTIDTHRKHLLAKFNVKNTAALIRLATKLKYVQ